MDLNLEPDLDPHQLQKWDPDPHQNVLDPLHPWTLKSNKSFTETVGAQLKVFAVWYRLLLQLLKKMDFSIRSFFNSTSFFQFYLAMYSTSPERGKATTTIHKYEHHTKHYDNHIKSVGNHTHTHPADVVRSGKVAITLKNKKVRARMFLSLSIE